MSCLIAASLLFFLLGLLLLLMVRAVSMESSLLCFFSFVCFFRACVSTRSCSSLIRLDFLHACDDDDDHDDDNDFAAPPDARVSFGGGDGEATLDHRSRVYVKGGDELLTFDTLMFIQFSNPPEHNQL